MRQNSKLACLKNKSQFQFNDVLVSFATVTTPKSQCLLQQTHFIHVTINGFRPAVSALFHVSNHPATQAKGTPLWGMGSHVHKPTTYNLLLTGSSRLYLDIGTCHICSQPFAGAWRCMLLLGDGVGTAESHMADR